MFVWLRCRPEGWFADLQSTAILLRGVASSPEPESLRPDTFDKAVAVPSFQKVSQNRQKDCFYAQKYFFLLSVLYFSENRSILLYIENFIEYIRTHRK
jgi:hypothetical protein